MQSISVFLDAKKSCCFPVKKKADMSRTKGVWHVTYLF